MSAQVYNCSSTGIHVSLRLRENDLLSPNHSLAAFSRRELLVDYKPMRFSQGIEHSETDIMAGTIIT